MKDPLVSADWLDRNLDDVVVLDATYFMPADAERSLAEFAAEHIPGARLFKIDEIADATSDLPHMLPTAEIFGHAASKLGFGSKSQVVVYDRSANHFSAPRVWFTLKLFGIENVFVLDGGLAAWKAAGKPVETGTPRQEEAEPDSWSLDASRVLSGSQVQSEILAGNSDIIDARARDRFEGKAPEPRAGLVSGHMQGGTCVPFTELTNEDGSFASVDQLKQLFATVQGQNPVVTCGSGMTACVLALGLERIGVSARLYDGSWAEWGRGQLGEILKVD